MATNTSKFKLENIVDVLRACESQYVDYYVGSQVTRTLYTDLAEDVHRTANKLRESGIKAGDCVGILGDNCYEWVVMDLALIEIQAICVGFPSENYPEIPYDELAEKYDLALLFTDKGTKSSSGHPWVSSLKNIFDAELSPRTVEDPKLPNKRDLFSLSFSSGTSGVVKCLKFSRKGTNSLMEAFGRDFTFLPSDSIFAFLPLSTIQQRWMLYTSIFYSFNLCLCTPARMFGALKEMKPTIVCSAPLLFETVEGQYLLLSRYLRAPLKAATKLLSFYPSIVREPLLRKLYARIYDLFGGNVRFFLVGAAPSRMGTLKFYQSIGLPLYEAWGVTEAGFLSWNVPGSVKLGSVGKPVYPESLEIAEDGEILVKHDHLPCLGYYDVDPEEEQRVFPRPGIMATGDIGHFDKDGFLYISGRKKDMVVTRGGYKIQPAELEKAIARNDYVNNVVVLGDEHHSLVAVISLRGGNTEQAKSEVEQVVEHLNKAKPAPARIKKVVFSEESFSRENKLLNGNLKVDRKQVYKHFKDQFAF